MFMFDGCIVSADTMPGGSLLGYDEGQTAVHEIGHWFGLLHTFNGMSCAGPGDYIADTPQERESTDGCPGAWAGEEKKDSCPLLPGTDPVHNFMDYSTDAWYVLFYFILSITPLLCYCVPLLFICVPFSVLLVLCRPFGGCLCRCGVVVVWLVVVVLPLCYHHHCCCSCRGSIPSEKTMLMNEWCGNIVINHSPSSKRYGCIRCGICFGPGSDFHSFSGRLLSLSLSL